MGLRVSGGLYNDYQLDKKDKMGWVGWGPGPGSRGMWGNYCRPMDICCREGLSKSSLDTKFKPVLSGTVFPLLKVHNSIMVFQLQEINFYCLDP